MYLRRKGKLSCGLTRDPIPLESVCPLYLAASLNLTSFPLPSPPLPSSLLFFFLPMRVQEWSGEMRCGIRVFFLLACATENPARQGPRQQIGEMQMGGENAPRWRSGPARMWLQPPGWSQHWQSAPIDGWTKPGTGCENGWGQSGNLTQTNKMKDREELPAKAFRQYNSQSNLLTANWAQEDCLHRYKCGRHREWLSFSWWRLPDLHNCFMIACVSQRVRFIHIKCT